MNFHHHHPLDPYAIADRVERDRGITISMQDGREPSVGYAVSLAGFERVTWPSDTRALARDLAQYVSDHRAPLAQRGNYLGVWLSGGRAYFDISRVVKRERDAISLARHAHQLAIYNLTTGQELAV